jgi:hypothetical protein
MGRVDRRFLLRACGYAALAVGIALLAVLPLQAALADTGPKPKMEFTFEFEGDPVGIVSGQQMECQQSDCSDAAPLEEHGPQRFWCDAQECHSMAYGYAPYHKLVIAFADRTRESNVFQKQAFSAAYRVTVLADDLMVTEQRGVGVPCCASASLPAFAVGLVLLRAGKRRDEVGWPALVDAPRLPR